MNVPSTQTTFVILGVSELLLAFFKRSGQATQSKDKGSFGMLWVAIAVSIFLAIYCSMAYPQFSYNSSSAVYWIGMLLFVLGIGLRWWSIIHLGRFFTVDVAIAKDHRVVSDGPYTLVRHPSYSGALMAFLGLGIMMYNWLAALLLIVPITFMFLWRMKVEEQALTSALGEAYTQYMHRTKRLIPFLY